MFSIISNIVIKWYFGISSTSIHHENLLFTYDIINVSQLPYPRHGQGSETDPQIGSDPLQTLALRV